MNDLWGALLEGLLHLVGLSTEDCGERAQGVAFMAVAAVIMLVAGCFSTGVLATVFLGLCAVFVLATIAVAAGWIG